MIDLNARRTLLERQRESRLLSKLDSLKTEKAPEALVMPLEGLRESSETQNTLNAFLAGFLQNIDENISLLLEKVSTNENLSSLQAPLKEIASSIQEVKTQEVKLTENQLNEIKEVVSAIKLPEIPEKVTVSNLEDIIIELENVVKAIPTIPNISKITGTVKVSNPSDLSKVESLLNEMQVRIVLALDKLKITSPDSVKINNEVSIKDFSELLDGIEELKKGFNLLINKEDKEKDGPTEVSITNFPPTMVPQPVTHISTNALKGIAKNTAITVNDVPTALPTTPLADRRALIVYNNSSQTVFIGGSEVTVSNGLPIPPFSFSSPLDAGIYLIIYGIVTSGTSDVRVMEISDESSGR